MWNRYTRRLGLLATLALAIALPNGGPAEACSCYYQTFAEAVQLSDAIFRGVVVAVEPETERPGDIYDLSVVVLPSAWWKGQAVGSLRLLTPASPALCGVRMDVGHEYLVFAYRYVDTLAADLCTRTHETYQEDPDIPALGPPQTVPAPSGSWGRVKALYR